MQNNALNFECLRSMVTEVFWAIFKVNDLKKRRVYAGLCNKIVYLWLIL